MLQHPDPAVRTYAVRHAEQLLARGDEPEPRDPRKVRDPHPAAVYRGEQDFPELDLMANACWQLYDVAAGGSAAVDVRSGRVAHAVEVERDVWYVYHRDLALMADWPDLPF